MNRSTLKERVAKLTKNKRHTDRALLERRQIIEQLQQTQQLLFAILRQTGRVRLDAKELEGLEGANITMRDDRGTWIIDFIPPGAQVPDGAAEAGGAA